MKKLAMMAVLTFGLVFSTSAQGDEPAIGHMVFFELKEKTPEAKKKLVAACYKYLKNHDGVIYFSAGPRAEEFDRDVNAKDWDVALHIVFKDKKAHDKYQPHPDHLKFIEENKDSWKGVKVYDSNLPAEKK